MRAARAMWNEPRFITVRYEDLTGNPAAIQEELQRRMPFLVRTSDFTDFHRTSKPSSDTIDALGGLRPIEQADRDKWRSFLPRVKGQIQLHGDIGDELIELGYEQDRSWESVLDGVEPDLSPSVLDESMHRRGKARMRLGILRRQLLYRLGKSRTLPLDS